MLLLDLGLQGLVQGAIYALIALGLTLVYGLLRILHVAHAALFTLGGYVGVIVTNGTGSLPLAILLAMVSVGVIGIGVYRFCYRPLLNRSPLVALIASIGLFIAAEEIYRLVFGPYGLSFVTPPLQTQVEVFPGVFLSHARAVGGGAFGGHHRHPCMAVGLDPHRCRVEGHRVGSGHCGELRHQHREGTLP